MFILKKGHQPGVYVPLRALFLVEDVTERTCSHASLGCLGIHSRIFRLRV